MSYRKHLMPNISPSAAYKATAVDSDTISRQAAIATAIKAAVDWHKLANPQYSIAYCIGEAMRQLPPASSSEIPNSSDTISRAKAIEALDKRFDSIPMEQTSEILMLRKDLRELPPAQPDVPDINVGDMISRQAAIDYFVINVGFHDEDGYSIEDTDELRKIWTEYFDGIPPAQPAPDNNGDLWVTVPDIDEVTCIYVQESKSKFCRIFYEERI